MGKIFRQFRAFELGAAVVFNLLFLNALVLAFLYMALLERFAPLDLTTSLLIAAAISLSILSALALAAFLRFGIRRPLQIAESEAMRIARGESSITEHKWTNLIAQSYDFNVALASALAQTTQRERATADFALESYWLLDDDLNFQAVSPATTRLWGYEPVELSEKPLASLLLEEDALPVLQLLKEMRTEKRQQTIETRIHHKRGTVSDIRVEAEWSAQESCYFCVVNDMSAKE